MSSKKKRKQPSRPAVGAPDVILSMAPVLVVFCLRTFVHACVHEDGSTAPCVVTHHVLMGLGVGLLALALMRLMSADKRTKRSFDFILALGGVLFALLPGTVLPFCDDVTMVCHTIMLPFARIAGALMVVLALVCEFTVDHEEPTGRKRRR